MRIYRPMSVKDILDSYKDGKISSEEAQKALRMDYLDSIGDNVVIDRSRELRKNIPEVIYSLPKEPSTLASIAEKHGEGVLLFSKANQDQFKAVKKAVPGAVYDERAKVIIVGKMPKRDKGLIGIMTAGNTDIPIAEEARIMSEAMGVECITAYDIGIAGLHRFLEPMKALIDRDVDAIVVVAGMEGALPTLVSSLSPAPVVGVPTSTGYGAGGKGEAALLCMLQTCSPGLSVVNIDNGIGGGSMASLIALRRNPSRK